MDKHDILEAIVGASSDAIVTADATGRIVTWNPAAGKIFGYTAKEAIGQDLSILVPTEFREAHKAGLARVVKTGKTKVIGQVVALRGLRKDGTEFPLELTLSTWKLGDEPYFGGIIRDMTEREALNAELRQSEERMHAIMRSANDAIVCADVNGNFVLWNAAASAILGYSEKEVLGKPITMIIPERFRDLHEEGIKRVAAGGERHVIGKTVRLSARHKDGHEFPVELSLSTWSDGGTRFFSGILRDISEQARLMDELSQSEERMRAIMQSANDAIVCADQQGKILVWNAAAEKMLGHKPEDVVGKSLTVIIPKQYRAAHSAGIKRVASGGERHVIGRTAELLALHADGREIPIELSLGTWEVGDARYFSGMIRDITTRKQAEEEIEQANRTLDEKNQQLESLSVKLAKYLSKQVYNSIFSGKTDVRVASYRKKLSVFFSDIQGFTDLTDQMEAETISALLNEYLSEMAKIAEKHGGTIDKFIGDGIMIFFGDPETKGEKQDAVACVKMALEMRDRIRQLCANWQSQGAAEPLRVRVGINTGFCTVGNFGSEDRLDYTIVGGQVNLTSRLETAADADQILISHSTYSLVKDEIECRSVGNLSVKGIARPVKTYEAIAVGVTKEQHEVDISGLRDSLNLPLDMGSLDDEKREQLSSSLRKALEALEKADD